MSPLRRFLQKLGPGLITGASDDDPSGIATYSMAGASLGFAGLWTAIATFPMMAAIQYICAKIGLVTGQGIAGLLRRRYSKWLLFPAVTALFAANTINAGADIGAVASGIDLLLPGTERWVLVPVAVAILVLQVWGSYRLIASTFKWLTLALFAYIGSALYARPDLWEVLRGTFVPHVQLDGKSLAMLTAILGTTISPYLFFWQASNEVEERRCSPRRSLWRRVGPTDADLRFAAADVGTGMLFSNAVMYFIILAAAATLHRAGVTEIQTARQAAEALRPLAGNGATVLMAIGLIGSGVLAIPILTGSAAYALAEACGWRCGLDARPARAPEFYGTIAASTLVGLALNLGGVSIVKALYWCAILNGFIAPPLMVMILRIAGDREIMGHRANGWPLALAGWFTTAVMAAAAVGTVLL